MGRNRYLEHVEVMLGEVVTGGPESLLIVGVETSTIYDSFGWKYQDDDGHKVLAWANGWNAAVDQLREGYQLTESS